MKVLVTGARSNMGYSICKLLAKRGHIVYPAVRTKKELETLNIKLKEEKLIMFPLVLDLENNTKDISDFDLDILVLQASCGEGGSILEIDKLRVKKNIDVNVLGNFKLLQDYLRYLYKSKKRGKIFLTSSLASFLPLPYLGSYTCSKVYLYQLAKTLRLEVWYQHLDVTISLIMPGAYYTGFNEVMIDNKAKDKYFFDDKAKTMDKWQKIGFKAISSKDYNLLVKEVVKELEKKHSKFIISRPIYQYLLVKLYLSLFYF